MANLQIFILHNFDELLAKVLLTFATRLETINLIVPSLTQHVSHFIRLGKFKVVYRIDFKPSTSGVENICYIHLSF